MRTVTRRLFSSSHPRVFSSCPVISAVPRSTRPITTLVTQENGGKYSRRSKWFSTCLVGGALIGISLYSDQSLSESGSESTIASTSKWNEWKQSMMTNYENRIREFSSPEKIFSVFASVSKNGKLYMTIDDFTNALIPHLHIFSNPNSSASSASPSASPRTATKKLPAAFQFADQDKDGLISFEEYLFFVTLLSIPEQSIRVAFQMMDTNGDNQVDQNEFVRMMSFIRAASPHGQQVRTQTSGVAQGWISHYFGQNSKGLTLDVFSKFLHDLKTDVQKMEFSIYDPEETGFISQRDFGMLLVSYAHARDMPQYIQRAESLDSSSSLKVFSFQQFQNFNALLEHMSKVEAIMQLYQMNGRKFKKQDLLRLSKIVSHNTDLNQQVIDTIMEVFDKNRDGSLDLDEFVTVLKRRQVRGLSDPRDTGIVRSMSRIWKCVIEG